MESILGAFSVGPVHAWISYSRQTRRRQSLGRHRGLVNVHATRYEHVLADKATLEELKRILPFIRKMKDDRNFIVHSLWTRANEDFLGRIDLAATARSGKDFSGGPCERLADIEKFADGVRKLADRLWYLARQFRR